MRSWPSVRVKDIARIEIGGTPARDQPRYWASGREGYPWLSIADLSTKWVEVTAETITAQGIQHSNAKLIPAGTVVMSFKLSIGRTAITACDMFSNEAIAAFYADDEHVNSAWLYYILPRVASQTVTDIAIKGATLNKSKLRQMETALPSLGEQSGIAEVLGSIDLAIQATEQLVGKLELIKQGVLHDLLTRGINDNGELRDPIRHPEQFENSPIGLTPSSWSADMLGVFVPHAVYGGSEALSAGPGIPVLRMNNIKDGEAELTELKFSDHPCYHRLLLRVGDVLFNRTNSLEHVGRTGIWRGQIEAASFASYLVRLDPDPKRLVGEFLNRLLNWGPTQTRIRRMATPGVQQVNVNPTNLRRTIVAVPGSISEQTEIVARLDALDESIRAERADSAKLRLLKQALMDDLLTGRVRVTPLLEKDSTP